jgi:hypothetical protein
MTIRIHTMQLRTPFLYRKPGPHPSGTRGLAGSRVTAQPKAGDRMPFDDRPERERAVFHEEKPSGSEPVSVERGGVATGFST